MEMSVTQEKLVPQLSRWLERYHLKLSRLRQRGVPVTLAGVREGMEILSRNLAGKVPEIKLILDEVSPGPNGPISLRCYHPAPERCLPVLIYLHGGGHVAGSLATADPICRRLAYTTNHLVVSVDYRLSPEYPYPAGLIDCAAVLAEIQKLLERAGLPWLNCISLAGDSAGGSLAASLANSPQLFDPTTLHSLILLYPGLDYTLKYAARSVAGTGYLLEYEQLQWYMDHTFPDPEDRREHSPLYSDLRGDYPSTFLLTVGYCPLAEEGLLYADRLRAAGVDLLHHHEPGMIHGYLGLYDLTGSYCDDLYQRIATFLQ